MKSIYYLFATTLSIIKPNQISLPKEYNYQNIIVYQLNWYTMYERPRNIYNVINHKNSYVYNISNSKEILNIVSNIYDCKQYIGKMNDIRLVGLFSSPFCIDTLTVDIYGHAKFKNKKFIISRKVAKLIDVRDYRLNPSAKQYITERK